MNQICSMLRSLVVSATLTLALTTAVPCNAQTKVIEQSAGVDNTNMGAYRALAQLSFQAFQKGDRELAAKLAKILERTWDRGEESGGKDSLNKRNHVLFEQMDRSMDLFIKPVIHYDAKTPDPAAVQAAYNTFLDELRQVDGSPH